MPSLADLLKINDKMNDAEIGLVEENLVNCPELNVFEADTIKGTQYKTLVRTGRPVGGFREINDPIDPGVSTFAQRQVDCRYFDSPIIVDEAFCKGHKDGVAGAQAEQASGVTLGAFERIAKQIYYGGGSGDKGFQGLARNVASSMVVDAAGTTTGALTSVYAVRMGRQDVRLLFGNERLIELDPEAWVRQFIQPEGEDGKGFHAYTNNLSAWIGLQYNVEAAVGRIKKIDAAKPLTDDLLADLIALFPENRPPTHIFMNRSARRLLQKSRSVVLISGAGNKATGALSATAPIPTEYEGIPIICTGAIENGETI